jgi:hypothetical protein
MKPKAYMFHGAYLDWSRIAKSTITWAWQINETVWRHVESGLRIWWEKTQYVAKCFFQIAVGGFVGIEQLHQKWERDAKSDSDRAWATVGAVILSIAWLAILFFIAGSLIAASLFCVAVLLGIGSGAVCLAAAFTLLILCLSGLTVAALAIATASLFAFALGLRVVEYAPLVARGVFLTCPSCGHRLRWPVYHCPHCGTPDDNLLPGVHGIFHHLCGHCSGQLPATVLTGRHKLRQTGRGCSKPVFLSLESREWHIAVVGARGSGKTTLMISGMTELKDHILPLLGSSLSFSDPNQATLYSHYRNVLGHGHILPKTPDYRPPAFHIEIKGASGNSARAYIYDAAGEVFESKALMASHSRHFTFIDAALLVLDPFAEEHNRRRFKLSVEERRGVGPADMAVREVTDRLIEYIEVMQDVAPGAQCDIPIAVVVVKADACGVMSECGGRPVLTGCRNLVHAGRIAEGQSWRVRSTLASWGLEGFIECVEARFHTVRYFVCSSLGEVPNPKIAHFHSEGVSAPYIWLLNVSGILHVSPKTVQSAANIYRFFRRGLQGKEGIRTQLASAGIVGSLLLVVFVVLWHIFHR